MTKKKDFKAIWKHKGKPALIQTGAGAVAAYTGSLVGSHHRVPPWLSAVAGLGIMAAGQWTGKPWLTAGGAAMFSAIRASDMQTSQKQLQMRTSTGGGFNFKDELHNTKEHAKGHLSAFSTKLLLDKLLRPKKDSTTDGATEGDSGGSDLGAVDRRLDREFDVMSFDLDTYEIPEPQPAPAWTPRDSPTFSEAALPEAVTMEYPGTDFDRF